MANFKQLYFTYYKFKLGQICVHFEVSYIYFSIEWVLPKNSLWCKIYGQKLINSSFWACHDLVVFMQFLNRDSTYTQQYYWYNLIFDNKVHSLHFSCCSSFYKRAFIWWHIMLVIPATPRHSNLKRLILKLLLMHNYCYYNKKGMMNLGEFFCKLLK